MSWSSGFISSLKGNYTPRYMLRFCNMPNFDGSTFLITGGFNDGKAVSISKLGPRIRGCSVIPGSWNVSFGSFSVPVTGDISNLFPNVRKGSIAELYAIVNGNKERIAVGQLRNIKGFATNWTLDFVDLLTAMTARASTVTGDGSDMDPDRFSFFYLTGKEVVIDTTAWVNSAGNFPTQMYVSDITPFERETAQDGIARCIDASGNEFTVAFDNVVSAGVAPRGYLNLTKVYTTSTKDYPSLRNCTDMAIGEKVYSSAMLSGKPYEIFSKLLLSVSGGNVTPFDKYPRSYNFGAHLNTDLFDIGDARNQKYIRSTDEAATAYSWDYVVTAPWNNGIREFVTAASLTGQFPVYRQDGISWRGAQNPKTALNIQTLIHDLDIVRINSIDIFDPNCRTIYKRAENIFAIRASVNDLTFTKTVAIPFLPAESTIIRSNIFTYGYHPISQAADRLRCAQEDSSRMFDWDSNSWSKITLTCRMRLAFLCAGDIVEIVSDYLNVFTDAKLRLRAMVLSCDYSLGDSRVTLQLAILTKLVN
jgi:hypothetical protein